MSEKILPPTNDIGGGCLACYFEQLKENEPNTLANQPTFSHTCGKGEAPDEQELERINRAAEEILRRGQSVYVVAEKAALSGVKKPSVSEESVEIHPDSTSCFSVRYSSDPISTWDCAEKKGSDVGGAGETSIAHYDETNGGKRTIKESERDPFRQQVGGEHYLGFAIQPAYFCIKNKLTAAETHVVKYVCRWKAKGGVQDLEKAKHWIDLLISCEKERTND